MTKREMQAVEKQAIQMLRGMVWRGREELVIGQVDHQNRVVAEYRIQPGQVIPERALLLMIRAGIQKKETIDVPRFDGEAYSRELVEAAARAKKGEAS